MKCKHCNSKVEKGQKFCTVCGNPIQKNTFLCDLIIAIVLCSIIGWLFLMAQCEKMEEYERQKAIVAQQFSEECPLEMTAMVKDNIIGYPELKCTIKNNTGKDVIAYKMYFIPRDVYGEERNNWQVTNRLTSDDLLKAGASDKGTWSLLDNHIKKGDLYIYSVTFDDGTSWGDRDAIRSYILEYGTSVPVSFEK